MTEEINQRRRRKKREKNPRKEKERNKEKKLLKKSTETSKTKATVIVSRKIVRQATNSGMSLGQFIKHNKLKLVDPSAKEKRRFSVAQTVKHPVGEITDSYTPETMAWYKRRKSEAAESLKKQDDSKSKRSEIRVRASPQRIAKGLKRLSTLQNSSSVLKDNLKMKKKRSGSAQLDPEKLVKVLEEEKVRLESDDTEEEEIQTVPLRCLNLNEWMVFVYIVILIFFGILLSIYEFTYYVDSICSFATDEIEAFWTYTEIGITTFLRLFLIPVIFIDLMKKEKSMF